MSVFGPDGQRGVGQRPRQGPLPGGQHGWAPMSTNPYRPGPGQHQQGFRFQHSPHQPPRRPGGNGVPVALGLMLGAVILVPLIFLLAGSLGSRNRNTSEPVVTTSHEMSLPPQESASVPPPTADVASSRPSSQRSTSPRPAPPTSARSPEPTPTPDPRPRRPAQGSWNVPDAHLDPLPTPDSNDPAWQAMQQAPIYSLPWPDVTGCPDASQSNSMAELKTQVEAAVECTHKAWTPMFERLGYSTQTVPIYYYEGDSATSACGTMQAPAFYCSANGGSLYFGSKLLDDSTTSRLWIKLMVFHEYGHHIQAQSKLYKAKAQLPSGDEMERRIEIQAECYATGMLRSDESFPLTEDNYEELRKVLQSFIDDGIHGSPESLLDWGMRGFHAETIGGCNTWVVGPDRVR